MALFENPIERRYFKIIQNREIAPDCYKMVVEAPELTVALPGQFFTIDCGRTLRRPLSLHGKDEKHIHFLYQNRGVGTKYLSGKRSGDSIDIMGPLGGNAFSVDPTRNYAIFLAGGIGVAPLLPLVKEISASHQTHVFIGAQNEQTVLCRDEFGEAGAERVYVSTDDGSYGYKGYVTDLFQKRAKRFNRNSAQMFVCGPIPMMQAAQQIAEELEIPSQAAMESRMACGVGACHGCAIKLKGPMEYDNVKLVCKDGPVFDLSTIDFTWLRDNL